MQRVLGLAVLGVVTVAVSAGARYTATHQHLPLVGPAAARTEQRLDAALTPAATRVGLATYYGDEFHGLPMADGTIFDVNRITAASNSWPLGTRLRLRRAPGSPWETTLAGNEMWQYYNRTVEVVVRDRGDFRHALDLSPAAFTQLGRSDEGVIRVLIEVVSVPGQ